MTGAIMTHLGATPLVACARMVASGLRPSDAARAADMTTTAAAASLTPGALPAVTVPSGLNAGRSAASASSAAAGWSSASSRMLSSREKTTGCVVLLRVRAELRTRFPQRSGLRVLRRRRDDATRARRHPARRA